MQDEGDRRLCTNYGKDPIAAHIPSGDQMVVRIGGHVPHDMA